jgi:ribosomal protein S12 methylthiotransferase accessory factor
MKTTRGDSRQTAGAETGNLEELRKLVSPRVGIIRSLDKVVRGMEQPNPPVLYQAALAHFDFIRSGPMERGASGKGETDAEAMASAIGEAVEHYCAYHMDPGQLRMARLRDLSETAISPFEFVLYSDAQYQREGFPCQKPGDNELSWVSGRELPEGKNVWVPASHVYLNYFPKPPEPQLCLGTSNGLAAGPNLESAMLNGICELVERDAFLLSWMNRLPSPRVDLSSLQGMPRGIVQHYAHFGIEVLVFNITVDLPIHVMMAVAIDRSGSRPAAVVGLGCSLDPVRAITKALTEVCQVYSGEMIGFGRPKDKEPVKSFSDVKSLEDHSAFFSRIEALDEMRFLLQAPRVQQIEVLPNHSRGNVQADLNFCVDALRSAGLRVICVDLTTPDIKDFGLRVARMLVTQLQPMHFGYGLERLGGNRLYEVPQRLGHSSTIRSQADINPCPHPLA